MVSYYMQIYNSNEVHSCWSRRLYRWTHIIFNFLIFNNKKNRKIIVWPQKSINASRDVWGYLGEVEHNDVVAVFKHKTTLCFPSCISGRYMDEVFVFILIYFNLVFCLVFSPFVIVLILCTIYTLIYY